jgi:predicted AlkP superfamily phosphohydrolase/phosphomutase
MLKIIYTLLIRSGINPLSYELPNYWEEVDGHIQLKGYHIQIGDTYLILWQELENAQKQIYEVLLNKMDNTKTINQFINKVKSL